MCEAAFGIDFNGIREFVGRALGSPQPPVLVEQAPAQEHIHTDDIDLARMLPALHHTAADAGRYVTAGIVIVRDPDTGTYNASYHRLQIVGTDRAAIKLDFGRHLRAGFRARKTQGRSACRSRCASAPTWRCTTPRRPWARRCRSTPTRSPSPADCAGGRSRS